MSQRSTLDGALRIVTIAAIIVFGVVGLADSASVLRGGMAWLVFLVAALAGWGHLVVRIASVEEADIGLRATWGVAGYLLVSGWLVAFGISSRPVILTLLGIGLAGFAHRELTVAVPTWRHLQRAGRLAREHKALAVVVGILTALSLVHIVGAVVALDRSPWDDDLAYTPLIRRLLDAGDLVEPFSLRRLGAYGGQTVLQAMAGARGSLANVHLLDRGVCLALTLLLVAGYARERKTTPLWTVLLVLVLLMMPNTAINTASYWSGAALLLALYRTLVREHWALVGLVAAAACTLRQSYIVIVVVLVVFVLLSRMVDEARATTWRDAWAAQGRRWLVVIGVGTVAILGWWIAAFVSSRTFLFPMIDGTFNHALSLKPSGLTWLDELQFLVTCCIETGPFVIVIPLFAVLLVARDRRPGRPLVALFAAVTVGFILMVHGFAGSEAAHLWRYAFGPAMALLAVLVIELGARDDTDQVQVPELATWVVLAALVIQLASSRSALPKAVGEIASDLRAARVIGRHGDPASRAQAQRYAALQAALPPNARVAVMLDDPGLLDFGRNDIVNLDHPGYASPGSQLPSFGGAGAWRSYFLEHGIRHVAFVRSDASRYVFRRPFWVWRIFNDSELFQAMSAYTIDAIDTLAELASTSPVLHDVDGLVAIDLGEPVPSIARDPRSERDRRGAFVRGLAKREGLHDAWSLSSRENVLFEDGFSSLSTIDAAAADDPTWFEIVHRPDPDPTRGTAVRWMFRRSLIRVRGERDMRLVVRGKVNLAAVHTRPRLDVTIDGTSVASVRVDETGGFVIDRVVSHAELTGDWQDVYLVWSTVSEPVKDARDLRVARLFEIGWEPAP